MQQDFGVGMGLQLVPGAHELVADRLEVVDLAVEDDPHLAVRRTHRLRPAFDIDDGEAAVAHHRPRAARAPLPVGPPVPDRGVHAGEQRLIGQPVALSGKGEHEAAHDSLSR